MYDSTMVAVVPYVVITTTVDNPERARELAERLVADRLAACVQRYPVASTYRWQGRVESASEILLQIKTPAARADDTVRFLSSNHPYDTPEIIVTPMCGGSPRYLAWMDTETLG